MIQVLKEMFEPPSAEDVKRISLREAEREAAEHQMAAEHHQALADMYRMRAERLRAELDDEPRVVRAIGCDSTFPPLQPQTQQ
jgi:hypothetical protein